MRIDQQCNTAFNNSTVRSNYAITISMAGSMALTGDVGFQTDGSFQVTGAVSGSGGITLSGTGSMLLSSNNTYTGNTTVNGGTLYIGTSNSLGASVLTLNGATLSGVYRQGTLAVSQNIVLGSGGGTFDAAGSDYLSNDIPVLAGDISGTGALTLYRGLIRLTGTNTYSGGTVIAQGDPLAGRYWDTGVFAGSDSVFGAAGTSITLNYASLITTATYSSNRPMILAGSGGIQTTPGTTFTESGTISGDGRLNIGSLGGYGGTVSLTGVNTYAGGTVVYDSANTLTTTLQINSDAALGAAGTGLTLQGSTLSTTATFTLARPVTLSGLGAIAPATGTTLTVSGVISGQGLLYVRGGGTLALTNANTYQSGTEIDASTLVLNSDGNLGSGNTVKFVGGGTFAATGTFASARNFTLVDYAGASSATQTFDVASGAILTLTGDIVDFGNANVKKTGLGKLVFNPSATFLSYTGATEVVAGTLEVDGKMYGAVQIDSGAYLQGTGTFVGSLVVLPGGHYKAGNSPGTATFGGPVTFSTGTYLEFDIDGTGIANGAGNYSRLVFSGSTAILTAGGILQPLLRGITGSANNDFNPVVGEQFNIVHTDAGVVGSFDSIEQPSDGLPAGTQFDAVYSSTDVDLVVTPVSYANLSPLGIADTANRRSLGAAIDGYRLAPGIRMTGDQNTVLTALYILPASAIAPALDQIAGTVYGDALNAAQALNTMFAGASDDHRNGANVTMASMSTLPGGQFAAINSVQSDAASTGNGPFWIRGIGAWSSTGTDGNAPGYRDSAGGVIGGVDLRSEGPIRFGLSFGYAYAGVTTDNAARATVQAERFAVYGDYVGGEWRLDGEVAMAALQFGTTRQIDIGALKRTAKSGAAGFDIAADATLHYGTGYLQPFVDVQINHVSRNGLSETHAGDLSLDVAYASLDVPRTVLGVDANSGDALPVTLGLRLGWAHDFGPGATETVANLVGSPSGVFSALSSRVGHDAGVLGLSLSTRIDDGISAFAEYNGELRAHQTTQAATAGLRIAW